MSKGYSKKIAQVVTAFLKEDDWKFFFDKKRGIFKFDLHTRGRLQSIQYLIDVKEDEIVLYGISPISSDYEDDKMMAEMAEYITRANYGLRNGKFEMDYDDGEIRYCSYIDCDNLVPSKKVVKNSIYCIARMFDRYSPGFLDIIFKGANAEACIEKCEKIDDEELRDMLSELVEERGESTVEDEISQFLESLSKMDSDASDQSETPAEPASRIKTTLFDTEGGEE